MTSSQELPTGMWYEAKRGRYRVRLYKFGVVRHRSYHSSYAEALQTYTEAKKRIQSIPKTKKQSPGFSCSDLLSYLCPSAHSLNLSPQNSMGCDLASATTEGTE